MPRMRGNEVWGRSSNGAGERQRLKDHLHGVARQAREFGEPFDGGEFCYWTGLWHDVGKASDEWQEYLLQSEAGAWTSPNRPDHKCAGAVLARGSASSDAVIAIHGHHGGLGAREGILQWLAEHQGTSATANALKWARLNIPTEAPPKLKLPNWATGTDRELFIRLAYSALVDADSLNAEAHALSPATAPRGTAQSMAQLLERFEEFSARTASAGDTVHQVRREVLAASIQAAKLQPGLFRLTVPTGGGKTRSAMAFALNHAVAHRLQRVIVAVPFTTITEQTAEVYRSIFERSGEPPVILEHHSAAHERVAVEPPEGCGPGDEWARLAAENWDAPIIVTTTVQLFESLFANRRTAMRKVHNLANSVIILDEAQSLPVNLLDPILDGLCGLTASCRTSVVLSTATQPAFDTIPSFTTLAPTEIVPGHAAHFRSLRRVDWDWRVDRNYEWSEIADWIRQAPQSLTIVNLKKHALELLQEVGDPSALHLSTLLCGAHRRDILTEVRRRLAANEPCRLISTQVVEAGVDMDFPAVFRALGPLDSLIQAAGRCNREGRLPGRGKVTVFQSPDGRMPGGAYRTAGDIAGMFAGSPDLSDPEVVREFSTLLLQAERTDAKKIQDSRKNFDFPAVARDFRMIEGDGYDVIVTEYGSDDDRKNVNATIDRIRRKDPAVRHLLRTIQPYTVSVHANEAKGALSDFIDELMPGLGVWTGGYRDFGLTTDLVWMD